MLNLLTPTIQNKELGKHRPLTIPEVGSGAKTKQPKQNAFSNENGYSLVCLILSQSIYVNCHKQANSKFDT